MKRHDLPAELEGRVFSTRHAASLGVAHSRLQASDFRKCGQGLYAHIPAGASAQEPVSEIDRLSALRFSRPDLRLSHISAARFHGLYLPQHLHLDERLHVGLPPTAPRPTATGLVAHRTACRPEDLWLAPAAATPKGLDGLVTSPARTWFDLAPLLSEEELIILGDQLVRRPYPRFDAGRQNPWSTPTALAALLGEHPGTPGIRRARAALNLIRVGADSPQETRLRLAILRAGLPEPELQIRVNPDDYWEIPADMGYRQHKLAIHYEGNTHRSPDQLERDIRRDASFARKQWTNLRFTREDARHGFEAAVVQIKIALGLFG